VKAMISDVAKTLISAATVKVYLGGRLTPSVNEVMSAVLGLGVWYIVAEPLLNPYEDSLLDTVYGN